MFRIHSFEFSGYTTGRTWPGDAGDTGEVYAALAMRFKHTPANITGLNDHETTACITPPPVSPVSARLKYEENGIFNKEYHA